MSSDWHRTARPFFTTFAGAEPLSAEVLRARVDEAVSSNCNVLMGFVETEGYPLWPTVHMPASPLAEEVDVVRLLVEEAHSRGLKFIASWMGVHCQTAQIARHPSWLQRDPWGRTIGSMCLNSPFGSLLLACVKEVVTTYPVDGVYFDGLYARAGGCYCDYCDLKFRSLYGVGIVSPEMLGASPTGERRSWVDFPTVAPSSANHEAFRYATVEEFLRRLKNVTATSERFVPVILDTLGIRDAFFSMAHDLVRMADSVDVFLLEAYWDARRIPIGDIGIEAALVEAETQRPVWWPRWLARHPDNNQVSVPPATVQIWAGQVMASGACPVPVEQDLYTSDPSLRSTVAGVMADVASVQQWTGGAQPMGRVVLLHSIDTKSHSSLDAPHDAREYLDSFYGAFECLREAHIPFQVLADRVVAVSGLPDDCAVLVLPNVMHMSDALFDVIQQFLARGGGVVATYRTGLGCAQDPAPPTRVASLLGYELLGTAVRHGMPGPEAYGGRDPVTYYQVGVDAAVGDAIRGRRFSIDGPYVQARASRDREVWAALLDSDYARMDGTRFFAWGPGDEGYPLAIAGASGGGRVVYFAAPLDALFLRQGHDEAAEMLTSAVMWASNGEVAGAASAPPCVDARIFQPDEFTSVVVLANRASNNLYSIGGGHHQIGFGPATRAQYARYSLPVSDITVDLSRKSCRTGDAIEVHALSGIEVDVESRDGGVTLTLPVVNAYDVVRVCWPRGHSM